jgi:hypothetical protein
MFASLNALYLFALVDSRHFVAKLRAIAFSDHKTAMLERFENTKIEAIINFRKVETDG